MSAQILRKRDRCGNYAIAHLSTVLASIHDFNILHMVHFPASVLPVSDH